MIHSGPMRNYTNGYHPAGGADPRYLNYGLGVNVPNLRNPRIPGEGISLEARHHVLKYIGIRPGGMDYPDYTTDYQDGPSQDSRDIEVPLNQFSNIWSSRLNQSSSINEYEDRDPIHVEIPGLSEPAPSHEEPDEQDTSETVRSEERDYDESFNERYRGGKIHCRDGNRGFRSGEVFSPSEDPCSVCTCEKFGPNCDRIVCDALPPGCFELMRQPGKCCPVCRTKGCTFNGRVLYLHETVQISPCETCQCSDDGKLQCSVADCTPPPCVDPVLEEGQCCPICPNGPNCNSSAGHTIAATVHWVRLPDDSCTECRCRLRQGISEQIWAGNRDAQCRPIAGCGT